MNAGEINAINGANYEKKQAKAPKQENSAPNSIMENKLNTMRKATQELREQAYESLEKQGKLSEKDLKIKKDLEETRSKTEVLREKAFETLFKQGKISDKDLKIKKDLESTETQKQDQQKIEELKKQIQELKNKLNKPSEEKKTEEKATQPDNIIMAKSDKDDKIAKIREQMLADGIIERSDKEIVIEENLPKSDPNDPWVEVRYEKNELAKAYKKLDDIQKAKNQ